MHVMPWDKKLSRPLVLKDGKSLETLSDVRGLFLDRFTNVTHSASLAHAAELLIKAAETGKRGDIAAATDQIELVLMNARMMR
jgi:hypothetical protein